VALRDRLRLRECESQGAVSGRLRIGVILADPRGERLERKPQALKELAPVTGGRGKNQRRHLQPGAALKSSSRNKGLATNPVFDLERLATYYTRPMSPPWSRPLEVDRLADGGADVDFAVPLAELSGLRSLRGGVSGNVEGRVHFTREQGLAVAELTLRGRAVLECQRCLKPMQLPLDAAVRIALVTSEAQSAQVPADLEPVLAPAGRVTVGELITEELLLTLPIVPRHEGSDSCAGVSAVEETQPHAAETQQPFAGLAELMKR